MITVADLREREAELNKQLDFAKSTEAKATAAYLLRELEIIELAIAGVRKSEHWND